MKIKILVGILLLSLGFLFTLSVLNQDLSAEFMKLVVDGISIVLWAVIPMIVAVLSFIIVGFSKEKFTFLVDVIMILVLISNMTFSVFLNFAQTDFGIIFVALFVWGSAFLFIVALLVKLLYSYFFEKNVKELIIHMVKVKIVKSLLLSAAVTFLLLQLYLMGSSIAAYKVIKASSIKEKSDYSLFYFYKPLITEIRLSNGKRWSYSRVKFVEDGR